MSKGTLCVKFPTRKEQMIQTIESFSKSKIKMLLCHGVSYDEDEEKYICDCRDTSCKSPGKHPISALFSKGEHSASSDKKVLLNGVKKYPNANIAAVIEGFFVIDVDGPKGMAFAKSLDLPKTLKVRTGRGFHWYFRGTLTGKTKRIEQVDLKTKGYIMLEPSRHITGKIYRRVQ